MALEPIITYLGVHLVLEGPVHLMVLLVLAHLEDRLFLVALEDLVVLNNRLLKLSKLFDYTDKMNAAIIL